MIEDRRPKSEDRSKMSDEYFSIFNTIKFSIFHYSKLPILHSSGLFPKGCPWQNPFIQNSIIPPFQNSMFNIRYSIFLFLVLTSHIKNQKSDFLYLPISPFRHSISNSFHHSIPSFQYSMFIIQYSIFLFLSLTSHIKNQKSDFLYHLLAPYLRLSISSSLHIFVSPSFSSSITPLLQYSITPSLHSFTSRISSSASIPVSILKSKPVPPAQQHSGFARTCVRSPPLCDRVAAASILLTGWKSGLRFR